MYIPIKKDLEEAYKDEFIKGFSLRESVHLALGILTAAGVTYLCWRMTGLSPSVCVYAGVPCAAPVLFFGFFKIQGLTVGAYLKEMLYAKRTRLLLYDADELPKERRMFTMEKNKRRKKKIGGNAS